MGHVGRRTLKWAFIEAAHGAAKKDATFRAIFDRRSDRGKRDRNRAYIAVARKLCVVGASCVRNGRRYTPAAPPRPGSVATREITATLPVKEKPGRATNTRQKRNGRPGLGQPDRAMVGVGDGI